MFGGYPTPKMGCDPTATKCPEKFADEFKYLHARVGLGFAFGRPRRQLISVDVGGWYGKHSEGWNDTANNKIEAWETLLMPMAGVSYFFAIH
jgi:hypothetical protein